MQKLVAATKRARPEEMLHRSVATYLNLVLPHDVFWTTIETSNQSGGGAAARKQAILKRKGVVSGLPDIWIFPRTIRALCLELKSQTGRLTDSQKETFPILRKIGIEVEVVRSIDEVADVLCKYEILRRI